MKNKYLCNFQKLLRAFLIFAMFATSSQIAAAQLNVALSNARLGTMIKQIKAQSKYQFFYDDNLASIPVHAVNLKNASLETVLPTRRLPTVCSSAGRTRRRVCPWPGRYGSAFPASRCSSAEAQRETTFASCCRNMTLSA